MGQPKLYPQDQRRALELAAQHQACVHCGMIMGLAPNSRTHRLHLEVNALGERIAWRQCPKCNKVSPLNLDGIN